MAAPQATSVFLSWAQSINDVVNNYTVIFTRIEGCGSAPTEIFNISGQLRNYTFTGLEEDIKYMIVVSAVNINMSKNASVMVKTAASGKHIFFVFNILNVNVLTCYNGVYYSCRSDALI